MTTAVSSTRARNVGCVTKEFGTDLGARSVSSYQRSSCLTVQIFLVLLQAAAAVAQPLQLENVRCTPMLVPVNVDEPNFRYRPFVVMLMRCAGASSRQPQVRYACTPNASVKFNVSAVKDEDGSYVRIELTNHTSCDSTCRTECTPPYLVNIETCKCECGARTNEEAQCRPPKVFVRRTCACQCPTSSRPRCPQGMEFDPEFCNCTCSQSSAQRCRSINGVFDFDVCRCISRGEYTTATTMSHTGCSGTLSTNMVIIIAVLEALLITTCVLAVGRRSAIVSYFRRRRGNSNQQGKKVVDWLDWKLLHDKMTQLPAADHQAGYDNPSPPDQSQSNGASTRRPSTCELLDHAQA